MAKCADCGVPFRDGKFTEPHKPGCKNADGLTYSVRTETRTRPIKSNEHMEQVKVINWCEEHKHEYPGIDRIFAIPNGGHRHKSVAGRMKAEGVKAGVPDLFLPVPRGGYPGLFIEMKYGKNRPTEKQKDWIKFLHTQDYECVICWSSEDAIEILKGYYDYD